MSFFAKEERETMNNIKSSDSGYQALDRHAAIYQDFSEELPGVRGHI